MLSNASLSGAYVTVTVPGTPTNAAASPGPTSATISFTPGSTGGGIVTYTVTASPGAATATGSGSPITINGLTAGTAYTFTVTATNSAGSSTASVASNSVTPTSPISGTSTAARWYLLAGAAPKVRVTYQTIANANGDGGGLVTWVGSFAAGQAQTNYSIRIDDMTTSTINFYSMSGAGTVEQATIPIGTLTASHAYKAWVMITQTDGQNTSKPALVQTLYFYGGATGGSVTPSHMGITASSSIPYNATASQIQTSINSISGFGSATVSGTLATGFIITTPTSSTNLAALSYSDNLTGGTTPGVGISCSGNGTRFVVPSGRVIYLEDYGAVGDGIHLDGTDYGAATPIYSGPITNALSDMNYGDTLKSKNPGVTLTGVTVTGTTLSVASGGLVAGHVGKPIIVYGGGMTDSSANYAFHTTVSSVAGNGKSAVLAAAVLTNVTNAKIMVAFPTYLIGVVPVDNNHGPGGGTIDMTGALCISNDPNYAGFICRRPDMTLVNIHYRHNNVTNQTVPRGNGKNNNDGTFFAADITGYPPTEGCRWIGCYAENSRDAAYLHYGTADQHIVDCIDDHSMADAFHATNGAYNIQFIRPFAVYPGDDGFANVGYITGGYTDVPNHVTWESPTLIGQDWGRGTSMIGCHDILMTDISFNGTALAAVYLGEEGGQTMDTHNIQVLRGTIQRPNYRAGQSPTYSQGSGSTATALSVAWLLLLSGETGKQQSDFRIDSITCQDGVFGQIVRYGTGSFYDTTINLVNITMTGTVATNNNWFDDSTWSSHIDLTDITVPGGSTPRSAPTNAGINGGGAPTIPSSTVAPTISGSAVVGQTLTATTGTWSATPTITTYAYQWLRGSNAVSGATNATYALAGADAGSAMSVQVSATNYSGYGVYNTVTASSAATATVTIPSGPYLVQNDTATAVSSATLTFVLPAAPAVGNWLYLFANVSQSSVSRTISASGWTTQATSTNNADQIAVLRRKVVNGDTATWDFTISGSTDNHSGVMVEITGANGTEPQDQLVFNNTSNTLSSPAATPTSSGELALAAFATVHSTNSPTGRSAGWTYVADAHPSRHQIDLDQLAAYTTTSAIAIDTITGWSSNDTNVNAVLLIHS